MERTVLLDPNEDTRYTSGNHRVRVARCCSVRRNALLAHRRRRWVAICPVVTNESASRCTFNVYGIPLKGSVTSAALRRLVRNIPAGGTRRLSDMDTKNELAAVASGYATLDCCGRGLGWSAAANSAHTATVGSAASGHTRLRSQTIPTPAILLEWIWGKPRTVGRNADRVERDGVQTGAHHAGA